MSSRRPFGALERTALTPPRPRRAGRAFFVAWSILGIASMTLLLSGTSLEPPCHRRGTGLTQCPPAVLTESWSARYKSSLTDGRFKKAYRRVKGKKGARDGESAQKISSRLLEKEGYEPLNREGDGPPTTVDDLPDKIVKALKGFHSHARYFMVRLALAFSWARRASAETDERLEQLGRNGHPPSELSALFAAAEDAPEGVDQLIQRGAASLAEAGAQGDTEHVRPRLPFSSSPPPPLFPAFPPTLLSQRSVTCYRS